MRRKNLVMSLLMLGVTATGASGALITNGSFEIASVDPGATYIVLYTGDTRITGWTVIGENIHYLDIFWQASDGSRSLDLDGATGDSGGIEQTFSTIPGLEYVVSFDMAGNPANAPTIKPMRVSADGQSQDFTFDITGRSLSDMGWTSHTWSFVADDNSATLAFESLTTFKGWGPALDNVDVSVSVSTIPAPGAILLGMTGMGLVGWLRRRKAI